MHVIWKYPITNTVQDIEMPRDAKILSVQYQGDTLCLWAMVKNILYSRYRSCYVS